MCSLWKNLSHFYFEKLQFRLLFVSPTKHSDTKGSLCPASVCLCVCLSSSHTFKFLVWLDATYDFQSEAVVESDFLLERWFAKENWRNWIEQASCISCQDFKINDPYFKEGFKLLLLQIDHSLLWSRFKQGLQVKNTFIFIHSSAMIIAINKKVCKLRVLK